jgi:3-hydroxyacyl-[acyl-carrier-protein] dehydratase
MNIEQIKEIIPHRAPFLLLDEIVEIEEGKRVTALKRIKADDFWFKGHFPEYPVVPGVLMIEMLAQAGAVAMLTLPEHKGKIGFLAGVDNAKFKRQVVPNDVLKLEVEITKFKMGIGVGLGKAYVQNAENALAVSAEIKFALGSAK